METEEKQAYYTETERRNKEIYRKYLEVLKELGSLATIYPASEIYRLVSVKPLPESFLTPKYIGEIIQHKKAKKSFTTTKERNTMKFQKNEAIYQNYLKVYNSFSDEVKPSEIELYRLTSLEPLPHTFINPKRIGRIINMMLTGHE